MTSACSSRAILRTFLSACSLLVMLCALHLLVRPGHELWACLCLELLSCFPAQAQGILLCVCSFPVTARPSISSAPLTEAVRSASLLTGSQNRPLHAPL